MKRFIAASPLAALDAKLGRCPRCMRQSFMAATAGLALAFIITFVAHSPLIVAWGWIIAFALLALWAAHIIAFSARATIAVRKVADRKDADEFGFAMHQWPRRKFIRAFAKTLLLVAAATVFPVSFRAATADDCICNQAGLPNGVFNNTRQECTCCAANQVGCTSPKKTWCCDKGHDCQGDDGCS